MGECEFCHKQFLRTATGAEIDLHVAACRERDPKGGTMKFLKEMTVVEWMIFVAILGILACVFAGCTDSTMAGLSSYGTAAHVRCWSGTALVYEGDSTGKVATTANSDGWEFKDAKTGKFVRVSGTCLVEN